MPRLQIPACAACPFAGQWGNGMMSRRACTAVLFLAPGDPDVKPRRFDLRPDGSDRYPSPPPGWCPLRAEGLTLHV